MAVLWLNDWLFEGSNVLVGTTEKNQNLFLLSFYIMKMLPTLWRTEAP